MSARIEKVSEHIGAEVHGVDIASPIDSGTFSLLREAFHRHSVLVFRGQEISDEQHVAFSEGFGPLEMTIPSDPVGDGGPVGVICNVDDNGEVIPPGDKRMLYQKGNTLWHSDGSFRKVPLRGSLLSAKEVPPAGGETEYASLRAAYATLSDERKELIEDLVAEHSIAWSRQQIAPGLMDDEFLKDTPPAPHPLVRRIPESGDKVLLVGSYTTHIVGWPVEKGRALLAELLEWATQPDFVYRHEWQRHDLVMWDNVSCLHRGRPWDGRYRRVMHRTTLSMSGPQKHPFPPERTETKAMTTKNTMDPEAVPARLDGLLRPEVLASFDRAAFEREGYWVWEGILTEAGRERFTASLAKLQQLNDDIIMATDWGAIDYAARGLEPPAPEMLGIEARQRTLGGSETVSCLPGDGRGYMHEHGLFGPEPTLVTPGVESEGLMPEYWAAAYDDFILDVITAHPQMMELLGKLFEGRFLLDHLVLMNRAPGSRGRRWHAHPYRDGSYEVQDRVGNGDSLTKEYLRQQCIRTLCYPEGADDEHGGELAVIPGSHLYRIPYKWDRDRQEGDAEMERDWLPGKIHAFTGEPLKIVHLQIPPGSMVSFVHHMPHFVSYRALDTPVRWGLLMAYRTPDPNAGPEKWSEGVPAHWAERMLAAGRLSPQARQVFAGDNPVF